MEESLENLQDGENSADLNLKLDIEGSQSQQTQSKESTSSTDSTVLTYRKRVPKGNRQCPQCNIVIQNQFWKKCYKCGGTLQFKNRNLIAARVKHLKTRYDDMEESERALKIANARKNSGVTKRTIYNAMIRFATVGYDSMFIMVSSGSKRPKISTLFSSPDLEKQFRGTRSMDAMENVVKQEVQTVRSLRNAIGDIGIIPGFSTLESTEEPKDNEFEDIIEIQDQFNQIDALLPEEAGGHHIHATHPDEVGGHQALNDITNIDDDMATSRAVGGRTRSPTGRCSDAATSKTTYGVNGPSDSTIVDTNQLGNEIVENTLSGHLTEEEAEDVLAATAQFAETQQIPKKGRKKKESSIIDVSKGTEKACTRKEKEREKKRQLKEDVTKFKQGRLGPYYEIEKILEKRILKKKPQYLVKWRGVPKSKASWENAAYIPKEMRF